MEGAVNRRGAGWLRQLLFRIHRRQHHRRQQLARAADDATNAAGTSNLRLGEIYYAAPDVDRSPPERQKWETIAWDSEPTRQLDGVDEVAEQPRCIVQRLSGARSSDATAPSGSPRS